MVACGGYSDLRLTVSIREERGAERRFRGGSAVTMLLLYHRPGAVGKARVAGWNESPITIVCPPGSREAAMQKGLPLLLPALRGCCEGQGAKGLAQI
ncbi:hypothetical protein CHN51_09065 [Sphingorhabdus sp. YGSMI21]|nr:hypothetical protein CHN51_09065 [Sphingorhabdus sp. YGSMI21]